MKTMWVESLFKENLLKEGPAFTSSGGTEDGSPTVTLMCLFYGAGSLYWSMGFKEVFNGSY